MFIGFLGPPLSGKTTIAAQVFAQLKKNGYAAEFIAERARWYIAEKRFRNELRLPLTDSDQDEIMSSQAEAEAIMTSSDDSIVVSDSCVLNSIFYRSYDWRTGTMLDLGTIDRYKNPNNLLYFSHVIPITQPIDANRVHSLDEARKISEDMEEFVGKSDFRISDLAGSLDMRVDRVLRDIYETYNGG
jgi:predicted ATPase